MIDTAKHGELAQMLIDAGFANGWSLSGETLVQWEHDADPPAPLTRPKAQDDLAD